MRQLFLSLLIVSLGISTLSAQRAITLEDIWQDYTFFPNYVEAFNFMNDGQTFTRLERGTIQQYDLRNGKPLQTILDASEVPGLLSIDGYEFTEDEARIILYSNPKSIYRHSFAADFYVYERESQELTKVMHGGQATRLAAVDPQGEQVAFVLDNDLYVQDITTGQVDQITKDGEQNKIINGAADWVYEEEFGDDRGFFWSPDGKQIAFYRFDESAVQEFTMTNYRDDMYPEYVTFKYPKVGEANSQVSIHIHDLASGETTKVAETSADWEYFPRIKWTNTPGELCVFT